MKNILTIACVAMLLSATSCKAQDMYKEIDDISYVSREDTSGFTDKSGASWICTIPFMPSSLSKP